MNEELPGDVYDIKAVNADTFKSISSYASMDDFCLVCEHSPFDQRDLVLQDILLQLASQITNSTMGITYKARAIKAFYDRSIRTLLPEDTPIWTIDSVTAHLNGLHCTTSIDQLKQIDVAGLGLYLHALNEHAIQVF